MKRISFIAAALLLSLIVSAQQKAVTEFSVCYLRSAPDYESALETQELMGRVVTVLDTEGYWVKVDDPQPYVAWTTDKGLVLMDDQQIASYEAAPKYICTALASKVYSSASKNSVPVSDLVAGDLLRKVLRRGGRPACSRGYQKVMLPSGKTGFVPSSDIEDYEGWKASREASPDALVQTALRFVGIPYLWGGMSSKGLDCSGLTRLTYLLCGVELPRNASQQVLQGEDVPLDKLQKGDLLFFGRRIPGADGTEKQKVTHVGMYIGGGRFIHSSHLVRINTMEPGDPDCYENITRLLCARRIIGL